MSEENGFYAKDLEVIAKSAKFLPSIFILELIDLLEDEIECRYYPPIEGETAKEVKKCHLSIVKNMGEKSED